MIIDKQIREIVREELAAATAVSPVEIVLIAVKDAADLLGVDAQAVRDLCSESETNGFPAVVLGTRTTKIDKRRLARWIESGGLKSAKIETSGNVAEFRKAG